MSTALASFEDHWKETIRQRKATLSKTAVAHSLQQYQDNVVFPHTAEPVPDTLKHALRKVPYKFQNAWPWPLVALIVCCYVVGIVGVVLGLRFFASDEDQDNGGDPAAAVSLLALAAVAFVSAAVVINMCKQGTSLKGLIQALHFVYMKDSMPIVDGSALVVYEIKVKQAVGCNKVRWVHIVLYSDGSWTEQADCCAW